MYCRHYTAYESFRLALMPITNKNVQGPLAKSVPSQYGVVVAYYGKKILPFIFQVPSTNDDTNDETESI